MLSLIAEKIKFSTTVEGVASWFGYEYAENGRPYPCPRCERESSSRKTLKVFGPQRWHCFHCDVGGDAIDWLAARLNCSAAASIRILASRLGLEDFENMDLEALVRHELFHERVRELAAVSAGLSEAQSIIRRYRSLQEFIPARGRLLHVARWMCLLKAARSPDESHRAWSLREAARADATHPPAIYPAEDNRTLGNSHSANHYRDELRSGPRYRGGEPEVLREEAERRGWLCPAADRLFVGACRDHRDPFCGRIVFPVRDACGVVRGFGARQVDPGAGPEHWRKAKYVNTAEKAGFRKPAELFGIDLALPAMMASGFGVLVEGYGDTVVCHQDDVPQAVAPCGGALSPLHAEMLSLVCSRVVVLSDPDKAGYKAARRWASELRAARIVPVPCPLPPGLDPDDFYWGGKADKPRAARPGSLRALVGRALAGGPDIETRVSRVLAG